MGAATVRELRSQGGRVLDRVLAGERVTSTRDGRPVARLEPVGRGRLSSGTLVERFRALPDVEFEPASGTRTYTTRQVTCTFGPVDVAISTFRAELSRWIERARAGEEVVVTDRGTPVARLVPVGTAPLLEQLVEKGVLSRPQRPARPLARDAPRVRARGPVAELVSEQRD